MNVPKYQDTQRNIGYGHITFTNQEAKTKVATDEGAGHGRLRAEGTLH